MYIYIYVFIEDGQSPSYESDSSVLPLAGMVIIFDVIVLAARNYDYKYNL